MTSLKRSLPLLFVLCFAFLAPSVGAQKSSKAKPPKPGKYFEDSLSLGYKFKAPAKFEATPAGPEEANLRVKLFPPKGSATGGSFYVLTFDSSDTLEAARERRQHKFSANVEAWLGETYELKEPDSEGEVLKLRGRTQTGRMYVYASNKARGTCAYVAEYPLDENVTLCIVCTAKVGKNAKKWNSAFTKIARTFERVKITGVKAGRGAKGLKGFRKEKYETLMRALPPAGDWRIETSDNYFIVTDVDDPGFIRKIKTRLEAIRRYYERDFPLDDAYKPRPKEVEAIVLPDGFDELPKEEQERVRAVLEAAAVEKANYDPMMGVSPVERSRTCVVKVFKDRGAYLKYGAPSGSAGYWWSYTEELCLYDNPDNREQSLGTLFHEAFHQYMYYYCGGEVTLHGWFNEGLADFYGGFIYLSGQIRPKEGDRRLGYIKSIIRNGEQTPLTTFITWFQKQYYGTNDLGKSQGANYAQGWSFVNFLLRGNKEKPKGWKRAWSKIISVYLARAFETGDANEALEFAFEDVDIDDMEATWLRFME